MVDHVSQRVSERMASANGPGGLLNNSGVSVASPTGSLRATIGEGIGRQTVDAADNQAFLRMVRVRSSPANYVTYDVNNFGIRTKSRPLCERR